MGGVFPGHSPAGCYHVPLAALLKLPDVGQQALGASGVAGGDDDQPSQLNSAHEESWEVLK